MKVAIVHDWFVVYSGAERVLEQIIKIYPDCDLFSTIDFIPKSERGFLKNKKVTTSFIQKLPFSKTNYRIYLPLMPFAIEQFDLLGYDLVISSSHAIAKGVITGPDQLHVCMCYSPMRYAWDLKFQYLGQPSKKNKFKRFVQSYFLHKLKHWDFVSAQGVDSFIAISYFIQKRISKCYRRSSEVIYPPVNIPKNNLVPLTQRRDYFVTHSRLVPYKKIDLIIEAFNKYLPNESLKIIGTGPEFKYLKSLAGENVEFIGFCSDEELAKYLSFAKCYLFAAEEDFGIAPLEAQAFGTPVIAYGKGGCLETIIDSDKANKSGILFKEHTAISLAKAVEQYLVSINQFKPESCRANAKRFSVKHFAIHFNSFIQTQIKSG